jgi:DNA-binding SARP family transcriptional activator
VKYELLGSLRVVDERGASFIGAPKVAAMLATLLVRADHVVTAEQLIEEIWGDDPPRRATAGIHVYVSDLRKFLHRPERADNPIVTRSPGYLLRLGESDELDYRQFLDLAELGRGHMREHHHEEATDCFERALRLWRGPMDVGGGRILSSFATWLTEVRMECTELLLDAQLQLGRHRELIGRIYSLTLEHPLREAFYRQLMLALHRSDRRADALKVYQSARAVLIDELALEPCQALQELHQAILRSDASVLAPAGAPLPAAARGWGLHRDGNAVA